MKPQRREIMYFKLIFFAYRLASICQHTILNICVSCNRKSIKFKSIL